MAVGKRKIKAVLVAEDRSSIVFGKVGKSLKILGGIAAGVGAVAIGQKFVRGMTAGIEVGREFERRMSGVQAVTQKTGLEFDKLTKQARELGKTTQFTASQAAQAMEELGKAGFEVQEILGTMPDVLNLAAAGELDMAEAASIASDVIRALGIDIRDFKTAVDVIAKTAISSKTTVQELGQAFSFVAPVARVAGVGITELSASLAILANRGLTSTRAGTSLRRIYAVFLGDLQEGEKGLAGFNLEMKNADGSFKGMDNALQEFKRAGVGALEIMQAFGLRGGPAMLAIMSAGSEEVTKFKEALDAAGGTAEQVASDRLNNLNGEILKMQSAFQEVQIQLFTAVVPSLRKFTEWLTKVIRAWSGWLKLSDPLRGIIRMLKLMGTALAFILFMIRKQLVAALRAGVVQLLAMAAGGDIAALSLFKTAGAMKALTAATWKQKLALAGIAVAVGVVAFQITRSILEMTGFDGAIEKFFDRWVNNAKDAVAVTRTLETETIRLRALVSGLNKEGFEIDLSLDPEKFLRENPINERISNNAKQLELNVKLDLLAAEAALKKLANATSAGEKIQILEDVSQLRARIDKTIAVLRPLLNFLRSATEDDLKAWGKAWEEAGKKSKEAVERTRIAMRLMGEEQDEVLAQAERQANMIEAGMKKYESALNNAGRASEAMGVRFMKVWDEVMAAAEFAGDTIVNTVDVFSDDIIAMMTALKDSGEDLTEDMEKLLRLAMRLREQNELMMNQGPGTDEPLPVVPPEAGMVPELEFPANDFADTAFADIDENLHTMQETLFLINREGIPGFIKGIMEGSVVVESLGETLRASFTQIGLNAITDFSSALVDAFFEGGKSLQKFFKNLLKQLAAAIVQALLFQAIMAAFGGGGGFLSGLLGSKGGVVPATAVASKGALIAGDRGIGRVPGIDKGRDSVHAILRPKEMVLPPALSDFVIRASRNAVLSNDQIPNEGTPGRSRELQAITVNMPVTISSPDATGVRQFFEDNHEELANGLRTAVRRGALNG